MAEEGNNWTPDKKLTAKITAWARQEIISLSDEYLGECEAKKLNKKKLNWSVAQEIKSDGVVRTLATL